MTIPLSSPGRTLFRSGEGFLCAALESGLHRICVAAGQRVSLVLPLIRNAPNLRGRRTGSFGWNTADARGLERQEAEPMRSSVREGAEALAGDTYGTG